MELFTLIDDNLGIARYPKGVLKQVKMYRRGDRVYLPHSGGFIEVRGQERDGTFYTSHPDVKLLEHDDVDGRIELVKHLGAPAMRWRK
jgi:hypothetical protein